MLFFGAFAVALADCFGGTDDGRAGCDGCDDTENHGCGTVFP